MVDFEVLDGKWRGDLPIDGVSHLFEVLFNIHNNPRGYLLLGQLLGDILLREPLALTVANIPAKAHIQNLLPIQLLRNELVLLQPRALRDSVDYLGITFRANIQPIETSQDIRPFVRVFVFLIFQNDCDCAALLLSEDVLVEVVSQAGDGERMCGVVVVV